MQDTTLISVANVLHRAGYVNDAIMTMSYALQSSRDIVVSQFTVANLYAAKVIMAKVHLRALCLGYFLSMQEQKNYLDWIRWRNRLPSSKGY